MCYQHINNLYKYQTILLFKRCYAMEKIHGTSAQVRWKGGALFFNSGGEKLANFTALFDSESLCEKFELLGHDSVAIYGEAYGGKQQGMSKTYGPALRFAPFEVRIGYSWLNVPNANDTGKIIHAMIEDVYREGHGEISGDTNVVTKEISRRTVDLLKKHLYKPLQG